MKTLIIEASKISEDEYASPYFIIEDEEQMINGYWLLSGTDQSYAEWYSSRYEAEKAMMGYIADKIFEATKEVTNENI